MRSISGLGWQLAAVAASLISGMPARAASLSITVAAMSPGQTVVTPILLSAADDEPIIASLQFDIEWDEPLELKPAVGDQVRGSTKVVYMTAVGTRAVRCLIAGMNGDAIPPGEMVKLFLGADGVAIVPAGIRLTNAAAADADGNSLPLDGMSVAVQIQGSPSFSMPPEALLNAASLAGGPVAPGEIVTFFGFLPSAPVLLFNGVPAPLLYAGRGQLNAVVPFGLDGSTPAAVELRNGSSTAGAKATLTAAAVAPALFTQVGSGSGPGAILNEDYSLNSYSNPAAPGSIIMVYGTGFGAIDPAAVDGQLAPGIASTRAPVTATIAGAPADVLYAGSAPGLVQGVIQVNVLVPPDLTSNPAAPIVLTVGSATTQASVTVSIR